MFFNQFRKRNVIKTHFNNYHYCQLYPQYAISNSSYAATNNKSIYKLNYWDIFGSDIYKLTDQKMHFLWLEDYNFSLKIIL